MDIQRVGSQQTHNITLTTFLPSHQIKHLAFIRLEAPKSVLHNNCELRKVTGLVAASNNTVKLYAVYERAITFQLGSWRMQEDIEGVVGWDKVIVIYTANKVVGLKYEAGCLKNCFMISLEFLNISEQDKCKVYADRLGDYLVIHIRNYLLLCFSQILTTKYKARVVQRARVQGMGDELRPRVQVVGDDVKWNQLGRNYIMDMVKIKLTDMSLCKIQQIQLIEDTIYFIGHRGKQNTLYFMKIKYFFGNMESSQTVSPVPHRDQPTSKSNVMVFHAFPNRELQFLYYNGLSPSVIFKNQQANYEVVTFEGKCQIFSYGSTMFPILTWQIQKNSFNIISKQKTFQQSYQFKTKDVINNFNAEVVAYREGLVVLASRTELILISPTGQKCVLHKSIGNIIDFHAGKDMLFIENYQKNQTRVFELSRGPRIDPRPFVTHKKKMFLQALTDLQVIYSIVISKRKLQILAVRRGSGANKYYTFYREGPTQFELILEEASDYEQTTIKDEAALILKTKEGIGKLFMFDDKGDTIQQINWDGFKMQRRWCMNQHLIAWNGKVCTFLDLNLQQEKSFQLIIDREGETFLNCFFQFRQTSIDKNVKDHRLIQQYLCYNGLLQIWLLDSTTGEKKLIHVSKNLAEGTPFLANQLINSQSFMKDKYRSITCPEYNLVDYQNRIKNQSKPLTILSSYVYKYQKKTLLLMVNSQEQLLIYSKHFNIDDGNFIFRRVNTPLNIVKNFKWASDKAFVDLGQGIIRIGNFLLYKGQILESISTRSLFRMEGSLWGLIGEGKIRLVQLGNDVVEGFCIKPVPCALEDELMGIQSTSHYYCFYSRKGFQIFTKQFVSHWKCSLGNETNVCLKMFQHYVGMSYYDYYCDEDGVSDFHSVRFRFRIYNCTTKNKIVEREKPLDEPILHIRYISPDKLLLVTSSLIFINLLKNDKILELYRTHNFSSKRSFLSTFSYIPDIVSTYPGSQSSPGYMLFGGSHGGLGFFVGKWIEQDKLKQQWFEGLRCGMREVTFLQYGQQKDELKALVGDEDGNLIVFGLKKYQAKKIADIRLGALVNSFKSKSGQDRIIYCSLSDGSIRLLTAVKIDNSQVSYLDFQDKFCSEMPFYGGFNERASRQLLQKYRSGRLVSKGNIVDGDILQNFFSLSHTLQESISIDFEMQISALKSIIPF